MINYFREHQKFPDDLKFKTIDEKLESNLCFTNKKREEINKLFCKKIKVGDKSC